MARLDVRVRVRLPAFVFYCKGNMLWEEKALISELSLNGAVLEGLNYNVLDNTMIIKAEMHGHDQINLTCELVRNFDNRVAVRFLRLNLSTQKKLWQLIKKYYLCKRNNTCPYCCTAINSTDEYCPHCHGYLNFSDTCYVERHYEKTFLKRLNIRTSQLNFEQADRIIEFVDSELIKSKESFMKDKLIGDSQQIKNVYKMIDKVSPTEVNVLILGESGTGKELAAREIHNKSKRKDSPFVTVNCAAIPEGLLEAELFGYEKGSFTGAYTKKAGKIEKAESGTLFLDEIGDMSLSLQAKILRFLQERVVESLGMTHDKEIDVRIIAATNVDLDAAIKQGLFRSDLYFRLDEFTLFLPPVRQREHDSVILASFFLNKFSLQMGKTRILTHEAVSAIKNYPWPGNVREIINKIKRAIVISDNMHITPEDLNIPDHRSYSKSDTKTIKEEIKSVEKKSLIEALAKSNNSVTKAAKLLGLSRQSIYNLKKKYFIQ